MHVDLRIEDVGDDVNCIVRAKYKGERVYLRQDAVPREKSEEVVILLLKEAQKQLGYVSPRAAVGGSTGI